MDRKTVCFSPDADIKLDVADFRSHLETAAHHHLDHPPSGDCPECIAHLHTAALLYRGDFLSGFYLRDSPNFEDWKFFQNEALRRDYAFALKKLVDLLQTKGDFPNATVFARRWLALDTLNEEAQRALIKIYALSGQRTAALRQYQECQRLLRAELDVIPEPETRILFEQIQSGELAQPAEMLVGHPQKTLKISEAADLSVTKQEVDFSAQGSVPTGVLQALNRPFVGRQLEVKKITALLANSSCWLVTLIGPGGIGKTRLALEVGLSHQKHFPHGVFFVPLIALETNQSIIPSIARATGLIFRQDGPSPQKQLLDYLKGKKILIILDSFETFVHSADLLPAIHFQANEVKLLVTSRHRCR